MSSKNSTTVGIAGHGWLFRDFRLPSQLDVNESPKLSIVQALNNPMSIFLINPNTIFSSSHVFFFNTYG